MFFMQNKKLGLYVYKAIILGERIERGWNCHNLVVMIAAMNIKNWTYFLWMQNSVVFLVFLRILTGTDRMNGVYYATYMYLIGHYYNIVKIIDGKKPYSNIPITCQ